MPDPVFDPNKPFTSAKEEDTGQQAQPEEQPTGEPTPQAQPEEEATPKAQPEGEGAPAFDPNKPIREYRTLDEALAGKIPDTPEAPSDFQHTALNQQEENDFQNFMNTEPAVIEWKQRFKDKYGEWPEIENSNYDYRGAWKAGIVPLEVEGDDIPHWGSIGVDGKELKSPDHPTRWKSEYFELTGQDPDAVGVTKNDAIKAMRAEGHEVEHLITSSKLTDPEYTVPFGRLRSYKPEYFDQKVDEVLREENKFNEKISKQDPKSKYGLGKFTNDYISFINDDFTPFITGIASEAGAGLTELERDIFSLPSYSYDIINNAPEVALNLSDLVQKATGKIVDWTSEGTHRLVSAILFEDDEKLEDRLKKVDADAEERKKRLLKRIEERGTTEPIFEGEKPEILQNIDNNKFTRQLENTVARMDKEHKVYDKTIEYYFKTGEYAKAVGAAVQGAARSAPTTFVAAFTGGGGLALVAGTAGAKKKRELDKVPDLPEAVRVANSMMSGALEYITEKVGTHQLGGLIKAMYKSQGKKAARQMLTNSFKSTFYDMYKRVGLYTAPVQEGLSEAANQWAQNWNDILTGVDPDRDPFQGVLDAWAIGSVAGGPFTVAKVAEDVQQKRGDARTEALFEDIATRLYAEQRVPEAPTVEVTEEEVAAEPAAPKVEEVQEEIKVEKEEKAEEQRVKEEKEAEEKEAKRAEVADITEKDIDAEQIRPEDQGKTREFIAQHDKALKSLEKRFKNRKITKSHYERRKQQLKDELKEKAESLQFGKVKEQITQRETALDKLEEKKVAKEVTKKEAKTEKQEIESEFKKKADPNLVKQVTELEEANINVDKLNTAEEFDNAYSELQQRNKDLEIVDEKEVAKEITKEEAETERQQIQDEFEKKVLAEEVAEPEVKPEEAVPPTPTPEVVEPTDELPPMPKAETKEKSIKEIEKRRQAELDKKLHTPWTRQQQMEDGLEANQEMGVKIGDVLDERNPIKDAGIESFITDKLGDKEPVSVVLKIRKPQILTDGVLSSQGTVVIGLFDSKEAADKYLSEQKEKSDRSVEKRRAKINEKYDSELEALKEKTKKEDVKEEVKKPEPKKEVKPEPVSDLVTGEDVAMKEHPEDKARQGTEAFEPVGEQASKPRAHENNNLKERQRFVRKPPKQRAKQGKTIITKTRMNKLLANLGRTFPNIKMNTNKAQYDAVSKAVKSKATGLFYQGEVFLDPTKLDAETPIEEFAHLWTAVAREKAKGVYYEGIRLIKDTPYVDEILKNPAYSGLSTNQVLEEALANAIADKGAQIFNQKGFKGFVSNLSQGISRPLKKAGFTGKVKFFEDTLEDFTTKVSRELLSGIPVSQISSEDVRRIESGRKLPKEVTIDKSLLDRDTWANKSTDWYQRMLSVDPGAGRKLGDIVRGVDNNIRAFEKEASFLVDDMTTQLTDYVNGLSEDPKTRKLQTQVALDQIQDILTDINEVDPNKRIEKSHLPDDLKFTVKKMRAMVDNLSNKLRDDNVLVRENIRAVINANLGVYLTRSYAMHDIQDYAKNWEKYLTPKQQADIYNFLDNTYGTSEVSKVEYINTPDGTKLRFVNEFGYKSTDYVDIDNLDDLAPEFSQGDIDALKQITDPKRKPKTDPTIDPELKRPTKGTYTLKNKTGRQNLNPIRLTSEDIRKTIIPSILGADGAIEKIHLGRNLGDMGFSEHETGILKERKDIAEPIRILMGEYTDPKVNFIKSVTKMATLLEKGKLWNKLKEANFNSFLSPVPTEFATEKLKTNPLQVGKEQVMYTTPEIKELLEPTDLKTFLDIQPLILLNGLTKAAVTVGSFSSQARNFHGAAINLMASGRFPVGLAKARRVAFADATKGEKAFQFMSGPIGVGALVASGFNIAGKPMSKEQIRELHIDATKRGLIGKDVGTGVIKDLIDLAAQKNEKSFFGKGALLTKKALKNPGKTYEANDEMFKMVQYWQEIKDFEKIYPDKTDDEIRDIAARKVRLMQPTYDLTPRGIKLANRSALFGSFVMFVSETYRTRSNIITEAAKEINEGIKTKNKRLAGLGAQRLAGSLLMTTMAGGMGMLLRSIYRWYDDDDRHMDDISPSYAKNSVRWYLSGDKENPIFLNMTTIDPASVLYEPIIKAFKGEDTSEFFEGLITGIANPFANPEIGSQAIIEAIQNKDQYDRKIANDQYNQAERLALRTFHVISSLIPTGIKQVYKAYAGKNNYQTDFGRSYNMVLEIADMATGLKPKSYNTQKMFTNTIQGLYTSMQESREIYSKFKPSPIQLVSKESRFEEAQEKSKAFYDQIKRLYLNHIRMLGLKKADEALDGMSFMPKYMREQIRSGSFKGIDKETGRWISKPKKKKRKRRRRGTDPDSILF